MSFDKQFDGWLAVIQRDNIRNHAGYRDPDEMFVLRTILKNWNLGEGIVSRITLTPKYTKIASDIETIITEQGVRIDMGSNGKVKIRGGGHLG